MKRTKSYPMLAEARNILLNHYHLTDDRNIIVDNDMKVQPAGMADGAHKIRVFGVSRRHIIYENEGKNRKTIFAAGKAMLNLGRKIEFQSAEGVAACRVKMYIFYPVVAVFFENEEKMLQLSLFTPRTITAGLACRFTRKRFEKQMEEYLAEGKLKKEAKKKAEKKINDNKETDDAKDQESGKKKHRLKSPRTMINQWRYGEEDYISMGELFKEYEIPEGTEIPEETDAFDETADSGAADWENEDDMVLPVREKTKKPEELRKAPPARKRKTEE